MPALRFLGSGDSQGVPRWWCRCPVCQEARNSGLNIRTRPSVLLEGEEKVLIDAAPELRLQMTREKVRGVDAVIITHAHNDHIQGLADLADRSRWTKEVCPVYMPGEVIPQVAERFPYLTKGYTQERVPFLPLEKAGRAFCGYQVTPIKVPHGYNGWSYALRFDGEGGSWAYMSDCIGLKDLEPWRDLDLLVLGTSFYHEEAPLERRSVYDVIEALELIRQLKPRRVVFTHLGHGIDRRKPAPQATLYAYDGLVLELP